MTDRVGTEILANGARRYASYDSSGNFVEYLYLLLADEPSTVGTALNKANLLTDATAEAIGLSSSDPTINEALAKLVSTTKITLSASGWSSSAPYTQTVTEDSDGNALEVTSSMNISYALNPSTTSESAAEAYGFITTMATGNGSVTFKCNTDVPPVGLSIILKGV